jgi:hypothetical protein
LLTFLEVNLEIIWMMFSKLLSFTFAKHMCKIMVVRGYVFEIHRRVSWRVGDVCNLD